MATGGHGAGKGIMTGTQETYQARTVEKALAILFGRDSDWTSYDRLEVIDPGILKSAFRRKSLYLHPDRAATLGMDEATLNEMFKRLHGAYRFLNRVVSDDAGLRRIVTPQATAERQAPPSADGSSSRLFTGRPPRSYIRFAQYLYYSRIIDWETMIAAVTWQRKVRPKIGEIGRSYRFLDHEDILRVVRSATTGDLFGATALRLNVIDRRQLLTMIGKQHNMRLPIGRYFIEERILTVDEVRTLVEQNRRHNMRYKRS